MSAVSEAFLKSCQLLHAVGYRDIAKTGNPVNHAFMDWEIELDPNAMKIKLCHKGFPIGVFGPSGGAIIGDAESDYIRDLDAALASQNGES